MILSLLSALITFFEAPVLEVPVECDLTAVCSIQKYVDHDPSPARADYACGNLSLDGDTGTDFRVPTMVEMADGVAVIAAADGTVKAVRDGMADISVRQTGPDAIKGREAGNGVVIDHGNGWETQYSHLRQGSISVQPGDIVHAGDRLGEIGLSGNTEFPHVEFTVRYEGEALDPFVGLTDDFVCGDATVPLWSDSALAKMPYRPAVFLSGGFSDRAVEINAARSGTYDRFQLTPAAPALVFWVDVSGILEGDEEQMQVIGPDGRVFAENRRTHARNNISWWAYTGKKKPTIGWQDGTYTAAYQLVRKGDVIIDQKMEIPLTADTD
ncbi:M23 family metallopeptidase [Parvularcula sp. IMCC14364]|uniref:M23 family metallopeptidase n=1 Tax=Parvularcula sp. IMCC14364 TaxID=3067902 RepID=UPI002741B111|nr:M23 family metallopeptidase [Parvularcula sp. IMCC14364]